MQREKALELVKQYVSNKNLLNHMLACEVIMRTLAKYFNEDEEKWGLLGLVHDIDYEFTQDDPFEHGLAGARILQKEGVDEDICYAVSCHDDMSGVIRKSRMDKALFCADALTSLIVSSALIKKEKKLENIDLDFLRKRFDDKGFARGASRVQIAACREINLTLDEFINLGLKAMQEISEKLGL